MVDRRGPAPEAPTRPDHKYHIGVALFKTGKFSESVKMFRKALELNPEDKRSKNMLNLVFNVPGYG